MMGRSVKVVETHPSCAGGGVNLETVLHEAALRPYTMRRRISKSGTACAVGADASAAAVQDPLRVDDALHH
jgi:hypothetical protein